MEHEVDVLVVGAGPTGLAAALDLIRLGLSVRVVEAKAAPSGLSKALVLHARTMEVFETLGVAETFEAESLPFVALNARPLPFLPRIRVDLAAGHWGDARFAGWRALPQARTEAVLLEALQARGGSVRWSTRLEGFTSDPDGVEAELRSGATTTRLRARWLLGCDGGQGVTRRISGIERPLTDLNTHFLLADVRVTTALPQDEGRAIAARDGVVLIVPMPEPDHFRLILAVPGDTGEPRDSGWYTQLIRRRTGLEFEVREVGWVSLFALRSGTAARFRDGPVFLLGDAAHLQSPVGGQGLNLGIQDAHNLAWKLAHVHRGWADEGLLDSYEQERRPVARGVVKATTLATRALSLRWFPLWLMRGLVASVLLRLPWLQRRFGPRLGMSTRPYNAGVAVDHDVQVGPFRGGARVPDLPLPGGETLHEQLHPDKRTVFAVRAPAGDQDHWVELSEGTRAHLDLPQGVELVIRPDRIVQSVRVARGPSPRRRSET